jgi:hypothetical protein
MSFIGQQASVEVYEGSRGFVHGVLREETGLPPFQQPEGWGWGTPEHQKRSVYVVEAFANFIATAFMQ